MKKLILTACAMVLIFLIGFFSYYVGGLPESDCKYEKISENWNADKSRLAILQRKNCNSSESISFYVKLVNYKKNKSNLEENWWSLIPIESEELNEERPEISCIGVDKIDVITKSEKIYGKITRKFHDGLSINLIYTP